MFNCTLQGKFQQRPCNAALLRSGRQTFRCLLAAIAAICLPLIATASASKPVRASHFSEPYTLSYAAGGYDAAGNFMGGTEFLSLVAFQGKLYGAVGYWMDRPDHFPQHPDPAPGPQVLVLDSSHGQWRQEVAFSRYAEQRARVSTMEAVTFHRFNEAGKLVGTQAEFLVAAAGDAGGSVFTRRSAGNWVDTHLPVPGAVRSLVVHYDPVAKVEKLYAGSGGNGNAIGTQTVYSGVYDPSAPGWIKWNPVPELITNTSRVMSMCDCDGQLFAGAKPSILGQNDQTQSFTSIYSYATHPFDTTRYASGFRGLTPITRANGTKFILSGFEGVKGDIQEIDPATGTAITELQARQFLTRLWRGAPIGSDIVVGYNNIPLVAPEIRLFGLLTHSPNPSEANSAWMLSRVGTTGGAYSYNLHEIRPLSFPYRRTDLALYSVRTEIVSPFPEDLGQVLFLGGYDGHFKGDHNTAWLYRVGIGTALSPYKGK